LEAEVARYVIAVRRNRRAAGVTTDRARRFPGIQVMGGDAARLIVEAAPSVMVSLSGALGNDLLVEPVISHHAAEA
jgi:hypothetical protein